MSVKNKKTLIIFQKQKANSSYQKPILDAVIQIIPGYWSQKKPLDSISDLPVIFETKSSNDGQYKIPFYSPGVFKVLVSKKGYISVIKEIEIKELGIINLNFSLEKIDEPPIYIGNVSTLELHKQDCPWEALMVERNRIRFTSYDDALKENYNGCYHCLREIDTG